MSKRIFNQSIRKFFQIALMWLIALATFAQSPDENYILKRTYIDTLGHYTTTIRYFDGLGRPYREVQKDAVAPGVDLVTATEYDSQGRDSVRWLPVQGRNGLPLTTAEIKAQAAALYDNDARPYSLQLYEPSALNRICANYGPGQAWAAADRAVRTAYHSNSATDPRRICRKYVAGNDDTLTKTGDYPPASLHVTEVTDEDGHPVVSFKNTRGQLLLTRSFSGDSDEALDTYYIYDGHGMLRWVLPPAASEALSGNGNWSLSGPERSEVLDQYAYCYLYDGRQQMITKKLPGCEKVEMIYDRAGRIALMQDGNLRAQGRWQYFYYDVFGNMREMGLCSLPADRSLGYYRTYISRNRFAVQGYTASAAMNESKGLDVIENVTPLQYSWYDDYDFLGRPGFAGNPQFTSSPENAKGKLTGSLSVVFGSTDTIRTVCHYNRKGRLYRTVTSNLLGGYDRETLTYTFTGQVATRERVHTSSASADPITERYTYTYDDWGKLLTTEHRLNDRPAVQLETYTYDVLGRNKEKKLHNGSYTTSYAYNIRSWLTSIESPQFSQQLYYNTGTGTPCYNGNISSMTWKAGSEDILRGYRFSYDGLSRLTAASYGEGSSIASNLNRYTENMTYDKMGNILSIQRYGKRSTTTFGLIDDLTLSYRGNQLLKVTDAVATPAVMPGSMHFTDNSNSATEYVYDGNGNLVTDLNKGIVQTRYNLLNLPQTLTFTDGDSIGYLYGTDGAKLRVRHAVGASVSTTDYAGAMIYENGQLDQALTENGYIDFSGASPSYHYYLPDHLGNNRVVLSESGAVRQVNHYYPFGGLMAESSGSEVQPRKFGGKELDRAAGLDSYDFGTRQYHMATAAWNAFDPLAEKNYSFSPYAYCLNNPVKYIDPRGEEVWLYDEDQNGKQKKIKYRANMKYSGDNAFVASCVAYLNAIYNNGGEKVLDKLIGSENDFNFKNELPKDKKGNLVKGFSLIEADLGGGDIYAGAILDPGINDYQKVESISHELFHGLQHEYGQGGTSIFNEVEANAYGAVVAVNWLLTSGYKGAQSTNGTGNSTAAGASYSQSFGSLVKDGFSTKAFINCVKTFRSGSSSNASGMYNSYPLKRNQKKYLLKTYYPPIK